jgi:hypothetical protein
VHDQSIQVGRFGREKLRQGHHHAVAAKCAATQKPDVHGDSGVGPVNAPMTSRTAARKRSIQPARCCPDPISQVGR